LGKNQQFKSSLWLSLSWFFTLKKKKKEKRKKRNKERGYSFAERAREERDTYCRFRFILGCF